MRTIAQLRQAGFTVVRSTRAVDCTEIQSNKPFWYYNTEFAEDMAGVREHLKKAHVDENGQYYLIVAGLYGEDEVLVYNLLDEQRFAWLEDAQSRYFTGLNDAARAKADYEDALNVLEPYMT
jgi:hypothetical protein